MKKILTYVFLILFLIAPSPVLANGGPLEVLPKPSFNAYPAKNDSIEVIHEDILYDISGELLDRHQLANVTVNYTMETSSDKPEKVLVAFPHIGNSKGVEVVFNGEKIKAISKKIKRLDYTGNGFLLYDLNGNQLVYNKKLPFRDIMMATNEELKEPIEQNNTSQLRYGQVDVIFFNLSFKPNSVNELQVSYTQPSGLKRNSTFFDFDYTYYYFLEPASYWKSFGDLDITIKMPNEYKILNSNLLNQLKKVEPGIYKGHFSALPKENLEFTVAHNENTKIYFLVIAIFLFAGFIWVREKSKRLMNPNYENNRNLKKPLPP